MIIKYCSDELWSWVSNIEEVNEIGVMPISDIPTAQIRSLSVLGYPDKETDDPYILQVCARGEQRILAIHGSEAYLIDEATGNTIEILIPKKRNKKK